MSSKEKLIYNSFLVYCLNFILLPIKLIIPQPIIARIPFLTTNKDIRTKLVLNEVNGKLLDIGCGNNELVSAYRRKGETGLGIDVYPWPGADMVVEDSSVIPFDDKSFDSVTFVACINHIPNRDKVLLEAHRLISDGGRLIITNLSPGISKLWHSIAFWDEDQSQRGMKEGEVWGLSSRCLSSLLLDAGFEIIEMSRFSWCLNQLYVCSKIAR